MTKFIEFGENIVNKSFIQYFSKIDKVISEGEEIFSIISYTIDNEFMNESFYSAEERNARFEELKNTLCKEEK